MVQQTVSGSPLPQSFDGMAKANADNMEVWTKTCGDFFNKVGRANAETLDFWARRLKEDFEIPSKIAHCHAPEEVAEAYKQFFSKMLSDYNEQAGKVIGLANEVVEGGLSLAQNGQAEKAAEAVRPKDKSSKI